MCVCACVCVHVFGEHTAACCQILSVILCQVLQTVTNKTTWFLTVLPIMCLAPGMVCSCDVCLCDALAFFKKSLKTSRLPSVLHLKSDLCFLYVLWVAFVCVCVCVCVCAQTHVQTAVWFLFSDKQARMTQAKRKARR